MKRKRILIIDDDKLFAQFIGRGLNDLFDVKISGDVLSGMDLIDSFAPDLIVLDILMPATNGLELLNEMASYQDLSKIPVIVCSSIAHELNHQLLRKLGVVRVLDKSVMLPSDVWDYAKAILEVDNAS